MRPINFDPNLLEANNEDQSDTETDAENSRSVTDLRAARSCSLPSTSRSSLRVLTSGNRMFSSSPLFSNVRNSRHGSEIRNVNLPYDTSPVIELARGKHLSSPSMVSPKSDLLVASSKKEADTKTELLHDCVLGGPKFGFNAAERRDAISNFEKQDELNIR